MKFLFWGWESLVKVQLPSDCCVVFWTNESEKQDTIVFLYKPTKKGKRFLRWKCHETKTENGKILLIWKGHVTMTKKDAYIGNDMQLQSHSSTFIHKNISLLSTTSIPSRSPMADNPNASLDKLTCTDYVDFGKCQDEFGRFSWSKNDFNYLDI